MVTFSRDQQLVVLLIILGMALLYFRSINMPEYQLAGREEPAGYLVDRKPPDQPEAAAGSLPAAGTLAGPQLLTLNKRINLNTATARDLEAVSGIGPATAEKIIAYRREHGKFNQVEDIMNVSGIKEKRFEKIKTYLTVK